LVFQPRLPTIVVPIVAIAVPFVDVLFALPIVIGMLIVTSQMSWLIVFWPAIMVVQFVLMAGIAWITASLSVYARDIPGLVSVLLTLLFYLTPVFYGLGSVPEEYEWVLNLNPMTTLTTAYRAAMVAEPGPSMTLIWAVTLGSFVLAYAGWRLFRRLEGGLADQL
jgi:lipopolysaccharide transport system permease protein